MTRKGGGRESGTASGGERDAAEYDPEIPAVRQSAAANPVAHDHGMCQACFDRSERIRELEAELNDYRSAHAQEQEWRERAEARVKDLERVYAENTDIKKLENDEARVKDLEAELAKWADDCAGYVEFNLALQKALHARDERSYPRP